MWFSKTFIKLIAYLTAVLVFGLCVTVIVQKDHLQLITQFEALREVDPRVKAGELADRGDYCQALEYIEYFMDYDYVKQNPAIADFYRNLREKRESVEFRGKDVWNGIWKGRGSCPESLVSSTVTDFLVIGDVRSLLWELTKWWNDEQQDDFIVALASIGILSTVLTYGTGGAAAPAKVSASVLKVAKKADKISAPLQKSFMRVFKEAKRTKSLKQMKPLSDAIYQLATMPNVKMRDALAMISRADNVRDIRLMPKVAKAYGSKTGKLLSLGGEDSMRIFRRFGNHKQIQDALDTAVKYGPDGTKLLGKVGPSRFLKYVTLTKYGARTTRSIWQGRLTSLLAWTMSSLPEAAIWGLAIFSGMVLVLPMYGLVRWFRKVFGSKSTSTGKPAFSRAS